eukprot:TRINITY_DN1244_c0_g1_i2.p1 TRINITY_DN1244_c0_g1~~TRINITY_DN1244_c0_g1_i2.p1  ORF type:complete len:157 (+),score=35.34 TRINITY_DN1244_c0_g1_i2:539-1009(+)
MQVSEAHKSNPYLFRAGTKKRKRKSASNVVETVVEELIPESSDADDEEQSGQKPAKASRKKMKSNNLADSFDMEGFAASIENVCGQNGQTQEENTAQSDTNGHQKENGASVISPLSESSGDSSLSESSFSDSDSASESSASVSFSDSLSESSEMSD